ncbi:condensation domain-containing protein [Streptomyces sp. XD-27]|uniref:condensation domain-containing protein n=1 Tax=Streptomyces sp. XD-27 TaxID=3062779 RepID=UPI0026F45714|nr:condensation domain-containing protein [Streptomyces sp. XD-27]WKX69503.1 condensation domain-containing protein [Streptomyces sp. XD-27]
MKTSGLEDVLPLSPLQEGLLFHALAEEPETDSAGADIYTTQLVLDLTGPLDAPRLRAAAAALLRRHANLRAGFRQRANGQPIQVVHREVPLPWQETDLTRLPAGERDDVLRAILADERAHRFDLAAPPALRFRLVRREERLHSLVLTNHHILWDGWSAPVLQRELLTLYAGHGDPAALPPVSPYRTYLAWLARQDRAASEEAWRRALDGLAEPTLVAPGPERKPVQPEYRTVELPEELTARLVAGARADGLTLNTLLQGVWAMVLRELTGRTDVVFGSVVSGRPPEISGIETMVGLFINTVPVRVRLDPDLPLTEALGRLQDEQALLLDHQQLRLGDVQRIAGAGDLFDTVLTVENYPGGEAAPPSYDGIRVAQVSGQDAAHYPLRLIAGLVGGRLLVRLEYRPDLYEPAAAEAVLDHVVRLVEAVADRSGLTVSQLPRLSDDARALLPGRAAPAPRTHPPTPRPRRGGPAGQRAPPRSRRSCAACSPRSSGTGTSPPTTTSSTGAGIRSPR